MFNDKKRLLSWVDDLQIEICTLRTILRARNKRIDKLEEVLDKVYNIKVPIELEEENRPTKKRTEMLDLRIDNGN